MYDHPSVECMELAIDQAICAGKAGDYSIGAVVVKGMDFIGYGQNCVRLERDPMGHAEIVAIREALESEGLGYLEDCVLYSTHEPCPMCTSTVIWAKLKGIVYGAKIEDMKEYGLNHGNSEWNWRTIDIPCSEVLERANGDIFVVGEFMREECLKLFHS